MNARPDVFGKYSDKMRKIHEEMSDSLFVELGIGLKKIERVINQSTFAEYLGAQHDHGYGFFLFDLLTESSKSRIMVGLNGYFYVVSRTEVFEYVADVLDGKWMEYTDSHIKLGERIGSPSQLALDANEMVQSVHYLLKDETLIREKKDFQLLKIIYPHTSLTSILAFLENQS